MNYYVLPLSCPNCGCELDHVASGRVYAGTECSAVNKCGGCGRSWQVFVALRPVETAAGVRKAAQRARERVVA